MTSKLEFTLGTVGILRLSAGPVIVLELDPNPVHITTLVQDIVINGTCQNIFQDCQVKLSWVVKKDGEKSIHTIPFDRGTVLQKDAFGFTVCQKDGTPLCLDMVHAGIVGKGKIGMK